MATKTPRAPKGPYRQPDHVLQGEAPGGVFQVALTQLGFIAVIFFTYVGLWLVLDDSARLPGTKIKPAAQPTMPIGYVHEIGPTQELQEVRETQAKLIGEYAVVDAGKGVYRMPIDEAMKLIAQRGLPVNASAFGQRPKRATESAAY